MRKEHAMHGRDHLPNGTDPIPGLGSGAMWAHLDSYSGITVATATDYKVEWDNFRSNAYLPGDPPSFTDQGFYSFTSGGDFNTQGDSSLGVQGFGVVHAVASLLWGETGTPVTTPKIRLAYFTQNDTGSLEGGYQTWYRTGTGDQVIQQTSHIIVMPQWSDGDYGDDPSLGSRTIEVYARHDDGSDRTLAWASLIVAFYPLLTDTYDLAYGTNFT